MILVPEIETVFILVPRTGSRSLRQAIRERYPRAVHLYRHMEADGVPQGYDRWPKVGVCRHPVARLWSLYKFLKTYDGRTTSKVDTEYALVQRASVDRSFNDWILHNRLPFTTPYNSDGSLGGDPFFSIRHSIPENRKSQFVYLRPDLGTRIYEFETSLESMANEFDLTMPVTHGTGSTPSVAGAGRYPQLTRDAEVFVRRVFAWEIETRGYLL